MTRKGRKAGAVLAAAAVAAGALGPSPAQAAPRPAPPATDPIPAASAAAAARASSAATAARKISWRKCPDQRSAQCGSITVPIDWAKPGRGSVKIAVARLKAAAPKQRLGVLFVNPGGPGGSGVDFALDGGGLSKQVRQRYDIVGFDPRGVGGSHPVECGPVRAARPQAYPRNQAEFTKLTAYLAALHKACRAKTGPVYDFLGAADVARDMDAIRAALGERKVSYYGVSYGTWLGQRYAELFPGRVRSLALDSTMDHSVAGAARFSAEEAQGLEVAYGQFAQWCATAKECALRGRDPVKVLDTLMTRAQRGRLHEIDSPKQWLSPPGLARMIHASSYDPLAWAQLGEELNELSRQKEKPVRGREGEEEPDGAFVGMLCADWSFPMKNYAELADVRARTRRAAPHVRVNPLGWEAVTACLGRPRGARDPQRPYRIAGIPRSLVVNGVGDPATVYPWALSVNRQVPGSALLTYEGTGHGAYGLSPCARKAVDAYLLAGRTPLPGARCPAVPPNYSARTRSAPHVPSRPRW
ncbi:MULTISPECIES: alpha/beta hydrolase [Actinomadura]|uniref:Alpha/beta hydrolase n=1 Tax=Actinomadura yumaensis TaxID=111807 RepID=A0ABW2C9X0_9ACTN|nr:alpha/beta hydrolase [Actinomadura sp. J1-007]